jgi:hypothetical protein
MDINTHYGYWKDDFRFAPATLRQVCETAEQLRTDPFLDNFEADINAAKYLLTGRSPHTTDVLRLNVLANAISEDEIDFDLTQHRDFDSLIGISPSLCSRTDLSVYPVSRFADRLSKSVHLTYPIGQVRIFSLTFFPLSSQLPPASRSLYG